VELDNKVKYCVDKFYFDNYRVTTKERDGYPKGEHGLNLYQHKDDEGNFIYVNDKGEYVKSHLEALNIYENNNGRLEGGRQHDPIYNDENAKYQVYTLGCSWTYGWCLEQEQSFPHLLGNKDTTIHNYGAGGTGLDFAAKTLSEVYTPTSRRQIFIITIPHLFRRTWFDDEGVVYKPWEVKDNLNTNEYNDYFYFLHHYNMLNTFVGRDKIIWSCWGGEKYGIEDMIGDKVDVVFEQIDYASDNIHPGSESHKQYAERLKDVLQNRFK